MDCSKTVLKFAETMTYNKIHPIVRLIEKQYKTGVKLTKSAMLIYEKAIDRLEGIGKWFVTINPEKARSIFSQEN